MHGRYTCTFFSTGIAKVVFSKYQQTNIARKGCENQRQDTRGAMSLKP